ncbi:BrnA antitoxin family protein [Acaryochloris sp. IP29b_bin.137]|uniref:BrnA antitoxin family protein n=1 Tax=Acaryochloris sp. IP29b_bin.137 TaxID=2969217 RepID=UPI00260530F9|nr:BrnA antitoxin family protein [Acaryochloris sp. IP29b_bin.137]
MNGKNLNNTSRTNWAALGTNSDEDIDYSDIPPLTDEFFERAALHIPADQAKNLVRLDPDVLQWFESQGDQYQRLINKVLRSHIATASGQQ